MSKKSWISGAVILLIVIVAFILQVDNQQQEVIKIGAILPLTGDAAQWGIPPQKGAQLAVEQINKKGGINGRHLELIIEDSRAEPKEGISAFNKLIAIQDTKIVIGAVASSVTLAIAPLAERNQVLLISPASTSPKISQAGDFIFRVIPSDDLRGKVFAEYLFNDANIHSISILYINNEGGVGNKETLKNRFVQLGGEIVTEEAYSQTATDLRTQLTKIKSAQTQALVVVSYPKDTILVIKQSLELNLGKPLYFQTEAVEDPQVLREAGVAAEGAIYILPAAAKGEMSTKFSKNYQKKYGQEPGLFAAEAYDIVYLIASALEVNSEMNVPSDVIRDYFYNLKGYSGASGKIAFDENGDVQKPMAIKQIINGQPYLIKER